MTFYVERIWFESRVTTQQKLFLFFLGKGQVPKLYMLHVCVLRYRHKWNTNWMHNTLLSKLLHVHVSTLLGYPHEDSYIIIHFTALISSMLEGRRVHCNKAWWKLEKHTYKGVQWCFMYNNKILREDDPEGSKRVQVSWWVIKFCTFSWCLTYLWQDPSLNLSRISMLPWLVSVVVFLVLLVSQRLYL